MRLTVVVAILLSGSVVQGFVTPRQSTAFTAQQAGVASKKSSLLLLHAIDPSQFLHDVSHNAEHLQTALSSFTLADLDAVVPDISATTAAGGDAAATAVTTTTQAAPAAADAAAAAAAAQQGNGWFGFLTGPIEGLLGLLHTGLVMVGVNQNAWGASIIAMTIVIKIFTFPLTKTQLESTNKMQALQPTIKEIQNKYQSNPEVMNQKIAQVYQENQVNPLAGCFPSLVQIPVFVGLYRSVYNLARENQLNEPFLFLPNLEGPTYGADPAHASEWITTWVDGVPKLGWEDTIAFLAIPIFLVISQYVSMSLMQQSTPQQQDSPNNLILKVLPLMIGWFSVNVPAALGIYWVANNIITTATTLAIRNSMPKPSVAGTAGGGAGAATTTTSAPSSPDIFTNPRVQEAPKGFSSSVFENDDVKPITAPIDAEIVTDFEEEEEDVQEDSSVEETTTTTTTSAGTGMDTSSRPRKKSRGKKKKKKRKY